MSRFKLSRIKILSICRVENFYNIRKIPFEFPQEFLGVSLILSEAWQKTEKRNCKYSSTAPPLVK